MHARTHTHARTHARTHAPPPHTHIHTHTPPCTSHTPHAHSMQVVWVRVGRMWLGSVRVVIVLFVCGRDGCFGFSLQRTLQARAWWQFARRVQTGENAH